ncbi:hypothetical protein DRQ32_05985, partial [bacterium]
GELLRGDSPSETCLNCNATTAGAVFANDPLLPGPEYGGGNFVFLLEDELQDGTRGPDRSVPGEAGGHSIVVPARGLSMDSRRAVAPGGSFPSMSLACTSCHDPHGNTDFRMLNGAGPVQGGLATFSDPAPTAQGIDLSGPPASDSNHTAYQGGWSRWCGNCHGNAWHESGASNFQHPVDIPLGSDVARDYNQYRGDIDPSGGTIADSYVAMVPFEDPLSTTSSTGGPSASSRLSCISCHRVHASSAPAAGRWDFNVQALADDGLASGSWAIPNPWPDPAQRSACVKCHLVDHDKGKVCLQCHAPGPGGSAPELLPTSSP